MLNTFLSHQWTGFWRSRGKGTNIAVQIFMGLIILYLILCALGIGFFMDKMIASIFPNRNVFEVFNGFILYYFALEFLSRLQLQELPTLAIVPYLHLNIPKRKLVNFLNIRALFTPFNIIPLFLFAPFCIIRISTQYGAFAASMYLVAIFSLAIFNNYLALYVKRLSIANMRFVVVGILILATLGLLEYFKVFSIAALSNVVFQHIAATPSLALVFTALAALVFFINANFLRKNLYTEELSVGEKKKSSTDYPFLDRFGEVGTLAALEIKLILRNKRSKSTVSKGLIFIFYGFLFYKHSLIEKNQFGMMLFAALFMTGNMVLLYGQFMFGWQSAEFDGILTNKVSIRNFIKAKLLLFNLSATVLTLVVSLYGIISWKILVVQFAAYFYSLGIAPILVLYMATRNYKAIDLSKGSSFNFQGVGATSMLMGLPIFLIPYLFYLPGYYLHNPYWGLAALGITGLACFFTQSFWVDFLVRQFNQRKYKIAEGFRER
jgi:hypothetical protein